MNNTIVFDSNDVQSVVSSINNGSQSLSNVSSSLASSFSPLTSCDLFVDGLNKLINKANKTKSSYEDVSSVVASHIEEYINMENDISNAGNNYMSYSDSTSRSGDGGISIDPTISIGDVNHGKEISTSLDDEVKKLDDNTIIKFIDFIKVNNNNNTNISDIFASEKTSILVQYLYEFCKQYDDKVLTISDETEIRRYLLLNILNLEEDYISIPDEYSIYKYKKFLKRIASDNNTSITELFTDINKKQILNSTLNDMYNGKIDSSKYGLSADYQQEFKKLVEYKVKENNVSYDSLFDNPLLLI